MSGDLHLVRDRLYLIQILRVQHQSSVFRGRTIFFVTFLFLVSILKVRIIIEVKECSVCSLGSCGFCFSKCSLLDLF